MKYYFAPLEGITGYLYRNIHHKHFPGIDRSISEKTIVEGKRFAAR